MSGFITLRSIVKELFGTFASYFVAERFKNIDLIEKAKKNYYKKKKKKK